MPRAAITRRRESFLVGLYLGVRRYALGFVAEVAAYLATLLAFQLISDRRLSVSPSAVGLGLLLVALALGAGEGRFRLYRRVWRVAGVEDARALAWCVAEATILVFVANALMPGQVRPFRIANPLLAAPAATLAVSIIRFLPRLIASPPRSSNRLLIVMSDGSDYATVKWLIQNPSARWTPVAVVTEALSEIGVTVMGVPVVGLVDDLEHWIELTHAHGVAFLLDDRNSERFRPLFHTCLDLERPVFVVPASEELLLGRDGRQLRQLSADDLIRKRPVNLELEGAGQLVENRVVMVTGAAGSIGSELSRILALLRPRRLVLLDNNESGLFDLAAELRILGTTEIAEVLASVTDEEGLVEDFREQRPEIVFHAAAYKHVPMLEGRPEQAVQVNVGGTRNVIKCAAEFGVEVFVLVSTDKAAEPTSVMGCSKRLCELMVLSHASAMRCWAVRFGNVIGSRGSVVPTFERQIEAGGPITITHPEATRYMMTIREAASLVVISLRLARPKRLYMLDMGQPLNILELARALIRARGLRPEEDIGIVFSGLRPGERLHEELTATNEETLPTEHPGILEICPSELPDRDVDWTAQKLLELAGRGSRRDLLAALRAAVAPAPMVVPRPRRRSRSTTAGQRQVG